MLLEVEELRKSYPGGVVGNDGVNLAVDAGDLLGLFGPNGAGKTTLVRQLVGLAGPDSGSIRIRGRDVSGQPHLAKAACSYQPQAPAGVWGLSPRVAVELAGRMRGVPAPAVKQRMGELFEVLDLGEWADKPLKDLSGGVARLVLFCAAVVAPGSLVILDEPTNDVDPHRRRALWGLVRDVADDGAAVVLVTHSVAEAERAVDRIAIMDAGRIVAEGSLAAMRRDEGWLQLSISLDGTEQPEPPPFLQQLRMLGRRLLARVAEEDLSLALQWAQELRRSGTAEEFSIGPSSLEDTYERLVPTAVGTPA